ncbi:hypothetical protein EMIHUDRAFT_450681 [Emiliania huxleyi CCMP1516]|uniref:Sodium/calcium exchanger membrane region domain-containing protein n=2 Tax=Emiliania huxleyi TaxID=2903 RepID=A0A0D3JKP8_EMIH1|nr:hypothetical protein EMIHUDRAFT_450681 [Emiliania huxleyi CCMP1516]EOD24083.1 hypothetical protein EMIHUDRAFT_450681 [Emiliania huxleyi CCMP1516]|eukprot:XP_005776512.1 hypothetical protein EMIHUDRAFT_450681 [Emiliania huxleyi CCMP1516]
MPEGRRRRNPHGGQHPGHRDGHHRALLRHLRPRLALLHRRRAQGRGRHGHRHRKRARRPTPSPSPSTRCCATSPSASSPSSSSSSSSSSLSTRRSSGTSSRLPRPVHARRLHPQHPGHRDVHHRALLRHLRPRLALLHRRRAQGRGRHGHRHRKRARRPTPSPSPSTRCCATSPSASSPSSSSSSSSSSLSTRRSSGTSSRLPRPVHARRLHPQHPGHRDVHHRALLRHLRPRLALLHRRRAQGRGRHGHRHRKRARRPTPSPSPSSRCCATSPSASSPSSSSSSSSSSLSTRRSSGTSSRLPRPVHARRLHPQHPGHRDVHHRALLRHLRPRLALSSIVVARKGEGDMAIAIANVLGVQHPRHHQVPGAVRLLLLHPLRHPPLLPPPLRSRPEDRPARVPGCRVQSTRVGCILNIPGIVMGTIVFSSGTSVPDSLSSMVVARKGEGDMAIAIANVLGVQHPRHHQVPGAVRLLLLHPLRHLPLLPPPLRSRPEDRTVLFQTKSLLLVV